MPKLPRLLLLLCAVVDAGVRAAAPPAAAEGLPEELEAFSPAPAPAEGWSEGTSPAEARTDWSRAIADLQKAVD